jgi:hypothetical protein
MEEMNQKRPINREQAEKKSKYEFQRKKLAFREVLKKKARRGISRTSKLEDEANIFLFYIEN